MLSVHFAIKVYKIIFHAVKKSVLFSLSKMDSHYVAKPDLEPKILLASASRGLGLYT